MLKRYAFTAEELLDLLPGSFLLGEGDAPSTFFCNGFSMSLGVDTLPDTCFIAMSYESWLKGSGNSGHYKSAFSDSHVRFKSMLKMVADVSYVTGIIAERPIQEAIDAGIPQIIVPNSYEALHNLAVSARRKMGDNGKIIAVAGAVGKTTTTAMIAHLLGDKSNYLDPTKGGHNARTALRRALSQLGVFSPDIADQEKTGKANICTLEVAESALWESKEGIATIIKPHLVIITSVLLTQWHNATKNDEDAGRIIAKVCKGIVPGGSAVMYKDMLHFDMVCDLAKEYGAKPVTYGETDDCDTYVKSYSFNPDVIGEEITNLGTHVEAVILGEEVSYKIGTIGKPAVLNSLAALTVAKLVGFDVQKLVKKLENYIALKNKMNMYKHEGVLVVNNAGSSEVLAMNENFKTFASLGIKEGGRKIVLLSRIVNLSEKRPKVMLGIKDALINSGFDKVFIYEPTIEFRDLAPLMPKELLGYKRSTVEAAVNDVLNYIKEGDQILIIGSVRGSDFEKAEELLKTGISAKKMMGWTEIGDGVSAVVFHGNTNKMVHSDGDTTSRIKSGLGLPLLLYRMLRNIHKGNLSWGDLVEVRDTDTKENIHANSLGIKGGDKIPLHTLFAAAVTAGSPDAIMAISGHLVAVIGEKNLPRLKRLARDWGVDERSVVNITGRYFKNKPQHFTTEDLVVVAHQLLSFDMTNSINVKSVAHKERFLTSSSILGQHKSIIRHLCFGDKGNYHAIAMAEHEGETFYIAVAGSKTARNRDAQVLYALYNAVNQLKGEETFDDWINTDKTHITIAGDTYCGERYTKWRKRRDIKDPMQSFGDDGYAYSFENVKQFLGKDSFNIINSECVLTPAWDEQQQTVNYIDFVLGGNPEKTLKTYKDLNVDATFLANNHMMDFGAAGCVVNKKFLEDAGFVTAGTGQNADEAEKPILLNLQGKQVIIFNAYGFMSGNRWDN
ncbi:MAG: CapA family protein, partial [Defluviitaleaceae bacterium]|nr:CapA family protein [Defluviitaleaceae bacterium]